MAITLVQHTSIFGATPPVHIPIAASGSGNVILVFIHGGTTSVSDNIGNTYIDLGLNTSGTAGHAWYTYNSIPGATSVILTGGGSTDAWVLEYSGVATISPVDTTGLISTASGIVKGPSLTNNYSGSVLVSFFLRGNPSGITGVQSPWSAVSIDTNISFDGSFGVADYLPGATGTFQAIFTPTESSTFSSIGVAFRPPLLPITLTLIDSVSLSDTEVNENEKTLVDSIVSSDSISTSLNGSHLIIDSVIVSDSAPGSFSIQSDHLAPVTIPIVEQLVNQLVPANVKTYFIIEE
jgi:hypothetical protein